MHSLQLDFDFGENIVETDEYCEDEHDGLCFDEDGYDVDGYDEDGYSLDGYDRDGYDRDGVHCDDEPIS